MQWLRIAIEVVKGWASLFALVTGGCFVRRARLGRRGKRVKISPTVFFKFPENIEIGDDTFLNHHCCIWASPGGSITIGRGVLFGPGAVVVSSNHGIAADRWIHEQPGSDAPVVIEDGVWLGANVVVTPGVIVGQGCVVGAGAVVTRDLPPMSVCVGVPARPIAQRQPRAESLEGVLEHE